MSMKNLVSELTEKLALPVIAAPMFIVSQPKLVLAQCINGIVGSMPSLNARPQTRFDEYLTEITQSLEDYKNRHPERKVAPYAINLIIHASNKRLAEDLEVCKRHKVPILITSLGNPSEVVQQAHGWGGLVFHDVTTLRHAQKAIEAGVDGLILVCNGAGGHAGKLNPFSFIKEVRKQFKGPIVLSGCITQGNDILAAKIMGADFVYMGTRFIASTEASAEPAYKQMVIESTTADIINTSYFTGVPGNYLRQSIINSGLSAEVVEQYKPDINTPNLGENRKKVWKDIWGAGQSVAGIDSVESVTQIVQSLKHEYTQACATF